MKEKKITKRERFNQLLAIAEVKANADLTKFIEHELELLAKKSSSTSDKPTAVQVANEGIKTAILDYMANEPNRLFTITEMQKEIEECAELTNQRISALIRQLKEDGKVVRVEEKRKAYFKIA